MHLFSCLIKISIQYESIILFIGWTDDIGHPAGPDVVGGTMSFLSFLDRTKASFISVVEVGSRLTHPPFELRNGN